MEALKPQARTVLGIDASTKSLAWAIFEGDQPVNCGEVSFNGSTVFERMLDAKRKTRILVKAGILKADYVAIEAAVRVNSVKTVIDLSYVFGVILGELMELNPTVEKVPPITWQNFIGNKAFTKAEKEAVYKEIPGKSKTWYQTEIRKRRKQRTMDFARNHFNIPSGSDNMSDAVGLAWYLTTHVTRR